MRTYEWNYTGGLGVQNNASFNQSVINSILNAGCVCSDCTLSGGNCIIPFVFYSFTPGILEYSNLNFSYGSNYKLNLTIRDSVTSALILSNVSIEYKTNTIEGLATLLQGHTTVMILKLIRMSLLLILTIRLTAGVHIL